MIKWIVGLFEKPPKYRLVPDEKGTFTLEKWDSVGLYLHVSSGVTKKEAEEHIKNLEREVLIIK